MDSDGRLTGEELRTLLEHEANLPPDEDARPHPNSILGLQQQRAADRHQIQKLQSTVAKLEKELSSLKGGIFNLCNGDRLLEDADNNLCILESYIETLKNKAAVFDPKVHAPNALQTNPGDENY